MTPDDTLQGLPPEAARAVACYRLSRRFDAWARRLADVEVAVRRWIDENELNADAVLVVDDSPCALAALVATLASLGRVVHAVTTDATAATLLAAAGGDVVVHVVATWTDVPAVWQEIRAAVVVADLYLGGGETGLDVLGGLRLPHSVVVSSHEAARTTVERAATLAHAECVLRTDSNDWQDRLRETVARLLTRARPSGAPEAL